MPVGFTTVRVNVGAFIIDGLDLDDLFDDEPVTGKLVLEPMLEPGKPVQVDDNGVMKIKAIAQFPVDIGATGDISHRGRDYVTVPAPTSATTNIGQLQWKATFKDLKYGLTPITVPAIYFWAVPGAEVNLAEEVNVAPGSTAVQISRGARGYGVVGAVPVEDEPAFAIEYETPTGTALSDPIPLPEGASVPDGGIDADMLAEDAVTRAKLAQAVRDELDEKLTQTEADASYVPLSVLAKNPDNLISGSIVRISDNAVTSDAVRWPDGTVGTYTSTPLSSAFPGAVDAYTVTYGSPVTKTFTQPAVTRDSTTGAVTAVPAIVES